MCNLDTGCIGEPPHEKTRNVVLEQVKNINRAVQPQKTARSLKFWI